MAPEQCGDNDANDIDFRSDVYSLGVVFYELLTGYLPYDLQKMAIHEAVRIIHESEPKNPHRLIENYEEISKQYLSRHWRRNEIADISQR